MSDPNVAIFWKEIDHQRELKDQIDIARADGILHIFRATNQSQQHVTNIQHQDLLDLYPLEDRQDKLATDKKAYVLRKRQNINYNESRPSKKVNQDRCTIPLHEDDLITPFVGSSEFSKSSRISVFGLPNYEEGMEIDPELVIQETDEITIPYSERSFDYNSWKSWKLKSGSVVTDLLNKASSVEGHPLRPEVWGIVRCGFKIAKPKWCNAEEYAEIQSYTKRPSLKNPPKHIIELLKEKSLESLEFEIKKN